MLTTPKIIERQAQPYLAITRRVGIPFNDIADATLPLLWEWFERHEVEPVGAPFFKYELIDMANGMEIAFGVPTSSLVAGEGEVVAATLPAGRYITATHHGHYRDLAEVTAELLASLESRGEALDVQPTPQGERFAARLEIYTNDPREVPEPENWETVLAFKLR